MLKKLIIGFFVVVGVTAVAVVGCSMMAVSTVDNAIQETERQYAEESNEIQAMMNEVQWVKVNNYGVELQGTFTNTSDRNISFMDAQVKFYNANGSVIKTGYISETDIAPNESRQITVYAGDDFVSFEVIVDNEWSHFE